VGGGQHFFSKRDYKSDLNKRSFIIPLRFNATFLS